MKTFKQFNEGLVGAGLKALGKTKLIDIAKVGIGGYAVKKGLDFLGSFNKDSKREEPKPPKVEQYPITNGVILPRQSDESLVDFLKRQKKQKEQIDRNSYR